MVTTPNLPVDPPMTDASRAKLKDLRNQMLSLHKILMDDAKASYEERFGPVGGPGNFLQLLLSHEWFAWLRTISELIVRIDEALELKNASPESEATVLLEYSRTLFLTQEKAEFHAKYNEAMQRITEVVIAHGKIRGLLGE